MRKKDGTDRPLFQQLWINAGFGPYKLWNEMKRELGGGPFKEGAPTEQTSSRIFTVLLVGTLF